MAIGRGSTCPMTITRLTMETRRLMTICQLRHAHSVQFPRSALNRRKMMAIGRGSTCPMTITRLTMETRRLMTICQLRRGAPLRSIVSGRILQRCRCAARGSTCPMTITRLTMETRRLMTICQLRRGAPLRSIVSGRILQRCRCAAPPPHNRISPRSLWRISSAGRSRTRFPYRRTTPIPTTPHRQNPIARLVNHSDGMHLSSLRPCSLVVVHPRSVGYGACGVSTARAAAVHVFRIAVRPRYLRPLTGKTRSPGSSIIPTGCISAACDRAASSRCIRAPLDCAPSLPRPSRLWRDDHILSYGAIGIR